ncbi:MAG TPA: gamma-glutamylcyclotransferase family protein [Caproicibacter sp.]|nr:gamma-glutamylcyclotransferase family protein [Caproicibacter sp.]
MKNDRKLYVAYGSNLNLAQMAERCPTARVAGTGVMEGWRLLFRGAHAGAVATVEPFEGGSVPVLVWKITSADETVLDRYEGWPYLYRKETVEVKLADETVQAMVYIMNEGRPLGQPSCYYYATILEGYQDAGFDTEILRKATADSVETEVTCNE